MPQEIVPVPVVPLRSRRWGRLLAIGLGGLISLAAGLAIDSLIRDLFARTDWLGWTGLAFAGLAVLAVLALVIREIAGLSRLKQIDRLRAKFAAAAEADDRKTGGRSTLGTDGALCLAAGDGARAQRHGGAHA